MMALLLSILCSVALLVNFRLHPRWQIDTFQAIIFNYPVCFLTGLAFLPAGQHFQLQQHESTYYAFLLGVGFVLTFLLSGVSTQKMGMTATSLANNISLVVPVTVSLLFWGKSKDFDGFNYMGLGMALVAVVLSTLKKEANNSSERSKEWFLPVGVFVMYGITNTSFNYLNAQYVTKSGATIPFTLTILLGSMLFGSIFWSIRLWKKQLKWHWKNVVAAIPLGIPNFLSFLYLLKALDVYDNNGAYVLPLYNIGVILGSSLVGVLIFKEKLSLVNWFGLLLAVLAIVLLSYQAFI